MTLEEALEIAFVSEYDIHFKYGDDWELIATARLIVEREARKQVAQEPVTDFDDIEPLYIICPNCFTEVVERKQYNAMRKKFKNCPFCGQKLKITAAGEMSPEEYREMKKKYFGAGGQYG